MAPLYLIPTIGQPFEHLIIGCVGPLPLTRSGAVYLLTVMCQSTRYPAFENINNKSGCACFQPIYIHFWYPKNHSKCPGVKFHSASVCTGMQTVGTHQTSSVLWISHAESRCTQMVPSYIKVIDACILWSNGC